MQGHIKDNIVSLYTRNGHNWSNSFPHILEQLGHLSVENAIFDGEIVALDENGHSQFQKLQNSLKSKKDQDLRFYIFDLLYLNGEDLRLRPLLERKELLKKVLNKAPSQLIYSEHISEDGAEFFNVSCEHKLEGIVSKLSDSPYRSGRNDFWAKTKCSQRQEFVIGGYTEASGGRSGFGALLLGLYEHGQFKYVGRVGTGFDQFSLRVIKKVLSALEIPKSPFHIKSPKAQGIHWVKPIKVAEVSFAQWTEEGLLRTPVFMGMREDKEALGIMREKAQTLKNISSPEKILFRKEKITKQEIADYYAEIAPHMLPYIQDRPLSLVRCPEGSEGSCFYQKHISGKIPESFDLFPIPEGSGVGNYLSINSSQGLRELVQLNAFELHAWNCHRQNIMFPDQILMDFDPGPGVPWKEVVSAAMELKELLEELGLQSFVKLTGGKGLHVHIPVAQIYDWDQIKNFSQTLALQMVSMNPKKYTANMSRQLRRGKIFIDYLRNGFGATAVVPYSLRAKPMSAVALPLEWNELRKTKSAQDYTLKRALRKIKRRKTDPWKGMSKLQQQIEILTPVRKKNAA